MPEDREMPEYCPVRNFETDLQKLHPQCNRLWIVFWVPNEGDRKRTYIPRLFSEYMLTFRVEEPMKMCVTNQIRNISEDREMPEYCPVRNFETDLQKLHPQCNRLWQFPKDSFNISDYSVL
jgi:hypothetical protein